MTVGTGSLRRRNAFNSIFAGRVFNDIRGNVDTRLKKLENGEYDGIILAAAGLERLGLRSSKRFSYMEFEPEFFVPAPCQGIIAVQSRIGETDELLAAINHPETFLCFQTEREVLRLLDAGCTTPVGAYARRSGERLTLTAGFACLKNAVVSYMTLLLTSGCLVLLPKARSLSVSASAAVTTVPSRRTSTR